MTVKERILADVQNIKSFQEGYPKRMEKTGNVWYDDLQEALYEACLKRQQELSTPIP